MQRHGGVEEVPRGEEQAHRRQGEDGAAESGGEAGGLEGEVRVEEEADGLEVNEEENRRNRKEDRVAQQKYQRLPLLHSVYCVDLPPLPGRCRRCRFASHFFFFNSLLPENKTRQTLTV